ncbi:hypothetical protein [Ruegeria arenilitoris]|uniref:hypothetical protein n=1 Tax=Ruegeria arenilitoris TaxID=1173585 RepID=UPI00147E0E1C|nr:hypothetical protein [Ruegeria arenilitoris]
MTHVAEVRFEIAHVNTVNDAASIQNLLETAVEVFGVLNDGGTAFFGIGSGLKLRKTLILI